MIFPKSITEFAWHFDPEVGGILEEFSRSFIGRLDASVQENFAYKNAERMLQIN